MFQAAIILHMLKSLFSDIDKAKSIALGTSGLVRLEKLLMAAFLISMRIFALLLIAVGIVFVHLIKTIWNFK